MPLILSANGSGILKWWVDASSAVYLNMRGHSGGGLSLGHGFPILSSTKKKLNSQSSTKIDIVGADDFMPVICWTRYFMKAQGYNVQDNIFSRIKKVPLRWKRTEMLQAASAGSTLTFGISSSPID
jgi:hypothetical protein